MANDKSQHLHRTNINVIACVHKRWHRVIECVLFTERPNVCDRPKQQGGNISSSWWQFERRKQGPNNGWMETDHTTLDTRNQWNNQNIQRRKNKGCMLHLPPQRTHTHDNARRTHPLRPRSPRVQFWVIRFDTTLWRRDSSDASLTESVKFGSVNCKFVSLYRSWLKFGWRNAKKLQSWNLLFLWILIRGGTLDSLQCVNNKLLLS